MGTRPIVRCSRLGINCSHAGNIREGRHGDEPAEPCWRNPRNTMFANKNFIDTLTSSRIYQDYERAFTDATGLPVTLRPVDSWKLPHRGRKNENPFCALMSRKSSSCAACLRAHEQLSQGAHEEPKTVTCFSGMSDTAVPVRAGAGVVGYLQTGQVFKKKPVAAQFRRTAQQLEKWGINPEEPGLRDAYFATKVLGPKKHDAVVTLLRLFAQHLSSVSNQLLLQQENAEPPMITRARDYIAKNQGNALSLNEVARAVNTSRFYFCKMLKKATGLNFTDYVSRLRVEKAKNLLLNPNLRVSEIAFEIGFQSLTHFNRVFRNIVGQSPTDYRSGIAIAA
jgi:AraC-like DNA-binding protein/ligand-binding sensor protein